MKAKRLLDGKIVEVQPHGWRNGEVISYHSKFIDFYKPEQLDFNVIETKDVSTIEKPFDWQSFRAEAAKDILCSMIQGGYGQERIEHQSELAVGYANELVKQLKENEGK